MSSATKKKHQRNNQDDHDRAHQWFLEKYGAPAAKPTSKTTKPKKSRSAREADEIARAKQFGKELEAKKKQKEATSGVAKRPSQPSPAASPAKRASTKRSPSKNLSASKKTTQGLAAAQAYFKTLPGNGKKQAAKTSVNKSPGGKRLNRPALVQYKETWDSENGSEDEEMQDVGTVAGSAIVSYRHPERPATVERALEVYERKPAATIGGHRTKKRSSESAAIVYYEASRGNDADGATVPRGSAALARASMAEMDMVPTRVCVEYERSKRMRASSSNEGSGFVSSFFRFLSLED